MINILILPVSGISLENSKSKDETENLLLNNMEADLKIRKIGGKWEDEIISTTIGSTLEFRIFVGTDNEYKAIAIGVKLPSIDDRPMFNYDWGILGFGSSEPKPVFPIGEWSANDTDVCWAWFNIDEPWSKTMTFKACIKKEGLESVELTVYCLKDMNGNYDEAHDSVSVLGQKTRFISNIQLLHQRAWKIFNFLN